MTSPFCLKTPYFYSVTVEILFASVLQHLWLHLEDLVIFLVSYTVVVLEIDQL